MKLIDADALLETIEKHCYQVRYDRTSVEMGMSLTGIRQAISEQPEAVVRCKNCRWGKEVCGNIECFADPNVPPEYHGYEWFCPNGERRTDD